MINKIEKLDAGERRFTLIAEKVNEIIEVVNKNYDPQAEEALKQVAQLEKKFDEHVHYAREMQFPTSTPDNPEVY